MTNEAMKKVLIRTSIFTVISLGLILHRAATKHIMITDAAGVQIDRGSGENTYTLLVNRDVKPGLQGKLVIPLSKTVSSDDIALEDRYQDHSLRIYIDSREEDFYLDNAIMTDLDIITGAVCSEENDTGSVCLDFSLDGLYVNESSLTESNTIEVSFFKPHEKYENVVVIDSGEEKNPPGQDVVLDIATELKLIADKDDTSGTKLYFTRLSDAAVSSENREAFIQEAEADMLVGLGVENLDNSEVSGFRTAYNEDYFLRKMANAELADILERSSTTKAGGKGYGVFPATDEDELIMESRIPSARVYACFSSGEAGAVLMKDSAYKKNIADGIYQGINEAFEEMK
jgi:N-acetylmuramoyl-L-alanine amidase